MISLWAEAVLGAIGIAYRLFDEDGRPLGELSMWQDMVASSESSAPDDDGDATGCAGDEESIVFDLAPSAYPGCRAGLDMNVSALRQVMAQLSTVLADLGWLRDRYVDHTGRPVSVLDLWRIGEIAISMPGWLNRRGVPIPARAAAQFKVSQGIGMICRALVRAGRGDEVVDARTLANETESRALLVSQGRACAGPPRLVHKLFEVATRGGTDAPSPPLAELLGDPDAFWAYSLDAAGLFHAVTAVRSHCLGMLVPARDALDITGLPGARSLVELLANKPSLGADHVAADVARAQTELNWRGFDVDLPVAPEPAIEVEIAALTAQISRTDRSLAGPIARALASAALNGKRMRAAVQPAVRRLAESVAETLGGSASPIETLFPELQLVEQRLASIGITP